MTGHLFPLSLTSWFVHTYCTHYYHTSMDIYPSMGPYKKSLAKGRDVSQEPKCLTPIPRKKYIKLKTAQFNFRSHRV